MMFLLCRGYFQVSEKVNRTEMLQSILRSCMFSFVRLMVWPGFTSSILQYEESIMLCADVSHKILRSETVLDFMYSLYYQVEEQRFRDACAKELIGLVILTK